MCKALFLHTVHLYTILIGDASCKDRLKCMHTPILFPKWHTLTLQYAQTLALTHLLNITKGCLSAVN